MSSSVMLWLCLLVVFLIVEGGTVALVSLWFAVGALAAMLVALAHGSFSLQIAAFLVISAGLLLALRPLVRKYMTPKLTRTNVDSIIGTTGIVTAAIDNASAVGQVKIASMYWTARSSSGDPIEADTLVKVDCIEGVKAFVSPAEVPAKV